MLRLTAAPGVNEWSTFVLEAEEAFGNGWMSENIGNPMTESYKEIRKRNGEWTRFTHWTTNGGYLSTDDRADKLSEQLLSLGDHLGSGAFGSVFECPWDDTKCIKVGAGHNFDGDIYGDGWLAYATFCLEYKRSGKFNPILSDVYYLYVSEDEGFFVALLDKYDCTFYNTEVEFYPEIKQQYVSIATILEGKETRYLPRAYRNVEPCPVYSKYAQELLDNLNFPRANDIHDGNLMSTGARLVLTDPTGNSTFTSDKQSYHLRYLGVLPKDPLADAEYLIKEATRRHHAAAGNARERRGISRWSHNNIVHLPGGEGIIHVDSAGRAYSSSDRMYIAVEPRANRAKVPVLRGWKQGKEGLKGIADFNRRIA